MDEIMNINKIGKNGFPCKVSRLGLKAGEKESRWHDIVVEREGRGYKITDSNGNVWRENSVVAVQNFIRSEWSSHGPALETFNLIADMSKIILLDKIKKRMAEYKTREQTWRMMAPLTGAGYIEYCENAIQALHDLAVFDLQLCHEDELEEFFE